MSLESISLDVRIIIVSLLICFTKPLNYLIILVLNLSPFTSKTSSHLKPISRCNLQIHFQPICIIGLNWICAMIYNCMSGMLVCMWITQRLWVNLTLFTPLSMNKNGFNLLSNVFSFGDDVLDNKIIENSHVLPIVLNEYPSELSLCI
jgi:hypothetical protein